jgi:hypothetical protein
MQQGVQANSVTLVGVLNACASIVALEESGCVHEQIFEHGSDSDSLCGKAWLTCSKLWQHGGCSQSVK